jgi:hypothetical protein
VSADGRYVVQLRTAARGGCSGLTILKATDGAGCAAFSVYDVKSGEPILGPVTTMHAQIESRLGASVSSVQ